jgi:4-hydroxysphinganine ceramide fatty acyl 2-hydroxylase
MAPSKRVRILTEEDVAAHKSPSSCWISRDGKVYDVTAFLPDHPGGDDNILKFAGQHVGDVMKSPEEHVHSDSAYDMLEEYIIGRLGTDAGIVDQSTSIVRLRVDTAKGVKQHRLGSSG